MGVPIALDRTAHRRRRKARPGVGKGGGLDSGERQFDILACADGFRIRLEPLHLLAQCDDLFMDPIAAELQLLDLLLHLLQLGDAGIAVEALGVGGEDLEVVGPGYGSGA